MFGLFEQPAMIELTDIDGQPIIIDPAMITSVHRHNGTTVVNAYNHHIKRSFYYKVQETPTQIKPYIKAQKV